MAEREVGEIADRKYQRILRSSHPLITQHCDPERLVGSLSAQELLTINERYKLNNRLLSPLNRLNDLVEWLPRKGGNWFERFAIALYSSVDRGNHPKLDGHVNVLKYLWEEADKVGLPLPEYLQIWNRTPEAPASSVSNHGNSLFGSCATSFSSSHGDSLDADVTIEPVEEQGQPFVGPAVAVSDIILDKITSLLLAALGDNWQRIYNYCHEDSGQFAIGVRDIKERYRNQPHMQVLMTLKLWTSTRQCTSKELCDGLSQLVGQQIYQPLHTNCQQYDGPLMEDGTLTPSDIDKISVKLLRQLSPGHIPRVAIYCSISDDVMATLDHTPLVQLTNILNYWREHSQITIATRHQLAVILNDLGVRPNTVM